MRAPPCPANSRRAIVAVKRPLSRSFGSAIRCAHYFAYRVCGFKLDYGIYVTSLQMETHLPNMPGSSRHGPRAPRRDDVIRYGLPEPQVEGRGALLDAV